MKRISAVVIALAIAVAASAQVYQKGLVDKTVAVIGGEVITLSDIEQEISMMIAQGYRTDGNSRCEVLENMMQSKLFLMQARLDSLTANKEMAAAELSQRLDQVRTSLGGDEETEAYFKKPLYKLRQEWQKQIEEQNLMQQEQQQIAQNIPEVTPFDVKAYLDTVDVASLPEIPSKYQMSQIVLHPDKEAAALAVKERLISIRERIQNGEKFSTLARLYSEDPGSARRGGELGMASRTIYWPAFSDAAMALKPGNISQVVETPDGFHIIEVMTKKGDMFNARHILIKPKYTAEDREKAFKTLDSLKTAIDSAKISFELAARFYSRDAATRTNGGQMSDPATGSAYFEVDQIKPQDYNAVKDLEPGQISEPIESLDNEGRNGNTVYKIVRLDRIVPSHTATFEKDYSDLLQVVENSKRMEAIHKFIDKKIKETYIIIDPLFKDCEFSNSGWATRIKKD